MMQHRKRHISPRVYMPAIMALVLVAGFYLGLHMRMSGSGPSERSFFSVGLDRYNKVNDVINYIHNAYVDSVSREHLTEESIRSLLKNLDPHSSYIPETDFRRLNDPLMGSFEGIGIEFNMIKDTVVVIHPIPGGPSEKAGIMPGDRIVMVGDSLIAGVNMSTDDVADMLMGEKGTTVQVSVLRSGVPDLLPFLLTRDKIPSLSMEIAYMADESTGYIHLSKFSATTHQEFVNGINQLHQEGMEKMILDLRGNGGGFLDAAIEVADELLEPGKLIVYTDGENRPRTYARARRAGRLETQPLVILIDEWSASASEIIAGAVQDNDRGLVIGRRSFGKGLVQEQIQLVDGSAMRLTVARYYTPTGRSIQKPYDEGEEAYFNEFIQRYHNGEMMSPDSIRFDESLRFETPAGRIVYGGGGIMPDIFVPVEENIAFFNQVFNRGHIYTFAFDYADRNRSALDRYRNARAFVDDFVLSEATYNAFLTYVSDLGVRTPDDVDRQTETLIKTNLKAYIGRNIIGAEAFYPVLHTQDRALIRALKALQEDTMMVAHDRATGRPGE